MQEIQTRETNPFVLMPLTEAQAAQVYRRLGRRILQVRGRYWQVRDVGFLDPVDLAATFTAREVALLERFSLGFRARLPDATEHRSGTLLPYVLRDVHSYGWHSITSRRRTQLRKCGRELQYLRLTEPSLLVEQGHEVVLAGLLRTQHSRPPSRSRF